MTWTRYKYSFLPFYVRVTFRNFVSISKRDLALSSSTFPAPHSKLCMYTIFNFYRVVHGASEQTSQSHYHIATKGISFTRAPENYAYLFRVFPQGAILCQEELRLQEKNVSTTQRITQKPTFRTASASGALCNTRRPTEMLANQQKRY